MQGNFEGWVNAVADCTVNGTIPKETDCTASLHNAFASGAHTVYFPGIWGGFADRFILSGDISVPKTVNRIVGHSSSVLGINFTMHVNSGEPNDRPLIIEGLEAYYGSDFKISHESARAVALVTTNRIGIVSPLSVGYRSHPQGLGVGDVYLNDVCGVNGAPPMTTGWIVLPGQRAWCRQLDTESTLLSINVKEGAVLWSLGWKTEGGESGMMNITKAAAVEFVGAFNYMNGKHKSRPAISITDSPVSLQWGGFPFERGSHPFERIIYETRSSQGVTKVLLNTTRAPGIFVYPAAPPRRAHASVQ